MKTCILFPISSKAWAAALFAAAIFLSYPSLSCSICGCGDPLAIAGDTPPEAGHLGFGLEDEYLAARAAADADPDATDLLYQNTIRFLIAFSPSDRYNLVAQFPMVHKYLVTEGGALETERSDQSGLGDIDLGARFFVLEDASLSTKRVGRLALSFGTTLPTGSNEAEEEGARIDQHGQLGTGAYGPYAGISYALQATAWEISGNLYGKLRTANDQGYAFGNAWTGGIIGQVRPTGATGVSLALEGRYAQWDQDSGARVENTGGTVLNLSPGLQWNVLGDFWLQAKVQVPVFKNLFDRQDLGETYTVGLRI